MKKVVLDALKNRCCVLCGKDEAAESFYYKYKDDVNICGVTSMRNKEIRSTKYLKDVVENMAFDEVCNNNELYLVICDKTTMDLYSDIFNRHGKKEFLDYIFVGTAEAIISQRKICLFMGSRVVEQLHEIVNMDKSFTDKYYSVFYSERHLLRPQINRMLEYSQLGKLADVYIYSNSDFLMYNSKILSSQGGGLAKDCRIISISDSTFGGYYPQIVRSRSAFSNWLYKKYEFEDLDYSRFFMAREDINLTKFILQGKSEEEIISGINRLDFYTGKEIEEHMQSCIDMVNETDAKSDIKVKQLLCSNLENLPYRSLDECNAYYLLLILEQVYNILGLQISSISNVETVIESSSGTELPIYPSVRNYFKLNIKDKYKVVGYSSDCYLSFNEYMHHSIQLINKLRKLQGIMEI